MTIIIAAKIKLLDILRIDVGKRNGCYFKDYTFLPLESSSVLIPKNDLGATIGSLDMERIQDSNSMSSWKTVMWSNTVVRLSRLQHRCNRKHWTWVFNAI